MNRPYANLAGPGPRRASAARRTESVHRAAGSRPIQATPPAAWAPRLRIGLPTSRRIHSWLDDKLPEMACAIFRFEYIY